MTVNKIQTPLEKRKSFRNKPLAGFTLMEIVVSLIILATVFGGLTATFVGVKRYVSRASRRLTAVNLGRQALNALYVQTRADTWNTGALTAGTRSFAAGAVTQVPNSIAIDNFTYGSAAAAVDGLWPDPNSYVVRAIGTRQYREVTVSVWYPVN
jgi:type II secretory pathway pseudopilin PulG